MRIVLQTLTSLCLAFLLTTHVCAAEPEVVAPWRQDQPPNPPYSPEEAISKMSVPDGFTVELVASEPEIVNPIAMAFDERGASGSPRASSIRASRRASVVTG